MLIVAMPKTASTSLIYTLGNITNLRIQPHVEKDGWYGESDLFRNLSRYHKSVYLKTHTFIEGMAKSKETIYRDHILPEEQGYKFLNTTEEKIVVLYRNPFHIYDNYLRTAEGVTEELASELLFMREKYFENYKKPNFLFVSYRELVLRSSQTLHNIASFWGLKFTKRAQLLKKKYTGEGVKRL